MAFHPWHPLWTTPPDALIPRDLQWGQSRDAPPGPPGSGSCSTPHHSHPAAVIWSHWKWGSKFNTWWTHGGSKLPKFWLLEGISMIPPRKVLAKWGDAQEKMWFLGFNQQEVTSETELAKIGVEATKMGGKQRISILMVGIYSHFYSFYGGTMSRYRIHRHCHMHDTMGSLWVSDTTTFGSHETYFELYVFLGWQNMS